MNILTDKLQDNLVSANQTLVTAAHGRQNMSSCFKCLAWLYFVCFQCFCLFSTFKGFVSFICVYVCVPVHKQ